MKMAFSICLLLIHFIVTIRPVDNFQLTDEAKAQIEEVNQKISPIANFTTSSSQAINGLLQTLQGSLVPLSTLLPSSSFFDSLLAILANFKLEPFTPKTDSNGNLDCLKNSQYNFCAQDASYPKWYTELIKPEVEKKLAGLSAMDVGQCGEFPPNKITCNTTVKTVEIKTVEVPPTLADKFNNSDLGIAKEFNFVLQTDSVQQLTRVGVCEPKVQKCTAGGPQQYDCKQVGPQPLYPPVKRSDDTNTNYIIVINQEGFLAATPSPIIPPCFCICGQE